MAVQVVAVRAVREPVTEALALVGSITANETIEVKAQVGGLVEEVGFAEGERVAQGTALFQIDRKKLAASLAQKEASLKLAETDLQRAQELFQRRIASRQEYDRAVSAYETAKADYELIKQQFTEATVKAPFAGVAGSRLVSPGQYVTVGQTLTSLVDLEVVKAEFSVPERFLGELRTGQKIAVAVAAYPGETFSGEVYFVAPEVDAETRTAVVKARIPNANLRLKPGMFANLNLTMAVREAAVVIPETALIPQGTTVSVMVVGDDQTAQPRPVRTGLRQAGRVEITAGLNGGELVVVEGHQKLRPGVRVTLAPEDAVAPYRDNARLREMSGS